MNLLTLRGVELTNSIDDYLDRHVENQLVQRVGRAAIVRAIIDAEYESYLNYDPNQAPYRFALDKIENTWFTHARLWRVGFGVSCDAAVQNYASKHAVAIRTA